MLRYIARCVVPVDRPPSQDGGAVLVSNGRIVGVGRVGDVARGGARDVDLGDVVLMPGLVNAHTHLELSWTAKARPPGGDWVRWVETLVELRGAGEPPDAGAAAARTIGVMRARGTVAVGDVANAGSALPALLSSGLHAMVFHELVRPRADDADAALAEGIEAVRGYHASIEKEDAAGRIGATLTVHAPHSTSPPLVAAVARATERSGAPLSIHVAESDAESRWLLDGSGPWADFLRGRGLEDLGWAPPGISPLAVLDRAGAVGERTLLVHAVGFDAADIETVRRRGASVVTCPRSNDYLGVGQAPLTSLLAAGVPVALGTDSAASCPDPDLFEEMAALRRLHPGIEPRTVVRMATLDGARCLGLHGRFGALAEGRIAAMVAVPLASPGDDPFETVTSAPRRVDPVGVLAS